MLKRLKKLPPFRKALKVAKRMAKDHLLNKRLPAMYDEAAQQPVDPRKVVFAEGKLSKMPDAYTLLWKWLDRRYDFDLSYVTLRQNSVRYLNYEKNCEAFVRDIATASYVFLNDASDVVSCLSIRPETKVVQLWHACGAFKKWGMSTADLKFGGTREQLLRHPYYKNLDLVTVSSPEVEWAYREAMVLEDTPEVVQAMGVSRTDIFYDANFVASARERVEFRFPACAGKKILLYAPTFRGHVKTAKGPDDLDIAALAERFSDEYVLLVKHHPFVKRPPVIPEGCEEFAFQVGDQLPIDLLLAAADVCISDYSSIVFEYSLFVRPMAFFSPDLDDYGDWRGFYYDYDELTPGPVFQDNDSLADWLAHLDERFDASVVERFRDRFMSACDGHATERIAAAVFGDALDARRVPDAVEKLVERNPQGPDISVIIPAYNASSTLPRAVESVLAQTYARDRMEIVIVDDCSTDGTWEVAKRYDRAYPGLFSIARTAVQSGSPSRPRNIGLEHSRGEYVFFLDADDWLSGEAVLKMLQHAVEWNSDVLAVKMRGRGGRSVPTSMFGSNVAAADIYRSKLMWTFAPLKLFRRSLVAGLRFPDFMPEDISFVLRAFVEADIVSIASDYDYYNAAYLAGEDSNISLTTWDDVESNLRAYEDLFGYIAEKVPEEERGYVLLRRLIRRDVYRTLLSIARVGGDRGAEWHRRIVELIGPYYGPDVADTAPIEKRIVLEAAFTWGYDELCEVVAKLGACDFGFTSFELEGEQVMCRIELCGREFECDVTAGMRSRARVTRPPEEGEDGALLMEGPLEASELFLERADGLSYELLLRDPKTGAEHVVPCEVIWDTAESPLDDDYPAKGSWRAEIPPAIIAEPLEAPDSDGKAPTGATSGALALPEEVGGAAEVSDGADDDSSFAGGAELEEGQPAAEATLELPPDIRWHLLVVMREGDLVKRARVRYPIISRDLSWGYRELQAASPRSSIFMTYGDKSGFLMLVERFVPEEPETPSEPE